MRWDARRGASRARGAAGRLGAGRRRARGLTLLEMLVVLVMIALISTLTLQGLGYVLGQRERFARYLDDAHDGELARTWYRRVTEGLYPQRRAPGEGFQGSAERLAGLTLQPLARGAGIPAAVTLRLEPRDGGVSLRYAERGAADGWELQRWPGASGAAFAYRDGQGAWHARWPPRRDFADPRERAPQLPAAVRLTVRGAEGGARVWQTRVAARRDPRASIRDLL